MVRGHRNDIDGLRAVAILPVLFYHAHLWPFRGGYVGVDVFFVISGYLITGLILRERQETGFSLVGFYDRRIRRIVPALAAMLLAATVAAWFVLLPDELEIFAGSLRASVLFYANILYWFRGLRYFTTSASEYPLLHIWSLSVEEQFYLLWPLALMALLRFRNALSVVILALAAASFALALGLQFAPAQLGMAFYLLPTRAWELLAGAFLAVAALQPLRTALARDAAAVSGIGLVAAAVLLPGAVTQLVNSVAATLGTVMILFASREDGNVVSRLLGRRLPVFVGQISYSLYLWHWPALVYASLFLGRALSPGEALAILAAVVPVATLSWRCIEQPIRRRRSAWRGLPLSFAAAAGGGALFVAVASLFTLHHGFPDRLAPDLRALDADAAVPFLNRQCGAQGCVYGDPALRSEAVVWGDSHAHAIVPGLTGFAAARGLRLREFSLDGCPPFPDIAYRASDRRILKCTIFNRGVLRSILGSGAVRLVILQAWWITAPRLINLDRRPGVTREVDAALGGLLRTLSRHKVAVLLVGEVPSFDDIPIHCLGRPLLFGRSPARACFVLPAAVAAAQTGAADAMLSAAAEGFANVRVYLPRAALCDRDGCHAVLHGRLLYTDQHHLSPTGARLVGDALATALKGWPPAP